jgi:hypothetical protein
MGAAALAGRDKLTLRLPAPLASFGLWVEQLVAESTGKHGKGVVPVTGEPVDVKLGGDRVVVAVSTEAGDDESLQPRDEEVPCLAIAMAGAGALSGEFLRWEVATATAGFLLDINPFDEPNVQQAKDATRVLLDRYQQQREIPHPEPHASASGIRLTLSEPALASLDGRPAQSFLHVIRPGDYLALLAYLPSDDPAWDEAVHALRTSLAARTGCATTTGFGPRYLHSTGQLHKGGANNGVFIVITADASEDLSVPGEPYTFGMLETAQALGDFASLEKTGRRAMLVRLPKREVTLLTQCGETLLAG